MRLILSIAFLIIIYSVQGQVRIDHVIAVVPDLEASKRMYATMGFNIKEGRLHENGLLNAHIKFGNHSSFELMTVKGPATDAIAKQYQSLLSEGEGGVYLALTGHEHDSLKNLLTDLEIEFTETIGKLWSYLAFPEDSYLAHLFFIEYHFDISTLNDPTDHDNEMNAIQFVEIEGQQQVHDFLQKIGVVRSLKTAAYETTTGEIRVVPMDNSGKRPRILSVTFEGVIQSPLSINWRK